jgi:hypothetical protein
MAGLKIPLSRPAETTNPGFVYCTGRFALMPVEPGLAHSILPSEAGGDWAQAARDYEERGALQQAARCAEKAGDRAQALRLSRQAGPEAFQNYLKAHEMPWLSACLVGEPALTAGRWDALEVELENQGFGPALAITVNLKSDSIEANPHTVASLGAGERVQAGLAVFPTRPGKAQIEIILAYQDGGGQACAHSFPFTLKIFEKHETIFQNLGQILVQPSGPIYNGPVDQSQGKVEAGGLRVEGDVGLLKPLPARSGEAFQFCPYCGKNFNLPKTPRHCPYCGEKLQ